ncbi:MAG: hypothetical protein HYY17_07005 [Planctomycetes bacterium]|nr:hypothetical protein [Planctomycetota bacterium]
MKRAVRVLAAAILALVGALTGTVVLCAALLPPLAAVPEGAGERLRRAGFRLVRVRFDRPRYEPGFLAFERVEEYARGDGERCDAATPVRLPAAGRPVPSRVPVAARLLVFAGLMPERGLAAVSTEEVAFASEEGVLRRRPDGRWESASAGDLPAALARLNGMERERSSLESRLTHPDVLVWTDAALEAWTRDGNGAIFADALLRGPRGAFRETLVRLLLESGDRDESARVVVESADGLLQIRLLDELSHPPGAEEMRGRAHALVLLARQKRGIRAGGPYLRDWLVGCLEDGSFDLVGPGERRPAFDRISHAADGSVRDRLCRVIRDREGASCAAAYLIVRRLDGEPLEAGPDPSLAPEAKRWWASESRRGGRH